MRRINRCFNPKLQDICKRAVQLEELDAKLAEFLPETWRNQCNVGSFSKGCLVLITKEPVWASQLRYKLPELRDRLRSEAGIYQLTSIKVAVALDEGLKPTKKIKTRTISDKARDTILLQANACQYLPLKNALYHLADFQEKNER